MRILTIRTDKPEAEIGLFDDDRELIYLPWQAHRELAETLHLKLQEVLEAQKMTLEDMEGVVVYQGPGSFTGLRIGLSVANTLADSLAVPIVAVGGDNWRDRGIAQLLAGKNDRIALPAYGSPPHITQPKR